MQLKCRTFYAGQRSTGGDAAEGVAGSKPRPAPTVSCRVSSAVPSHSATRQLMSGWLTLMCLCDSVVCMRGNERGGVDGQPWWMCEGGSVVSPG